MRDTLSLILLGISAAALLILTSLTSNHAPREETTSHQDTEISFVHIVTKPEVIPKGADIDADIHSILSASLAHLNYSRDQTHNQIESYLINERLADSNVSKNCFWCNVGVLTAQNLFRLGYTKDVIAVAIAKICKQLKVEEAEVCDGLVKLYKDEVLTVLDQLVLDPDEVCGIILGDDCGSGVYNPYAMWYISWPHPPKPPVTPLTPPNPKSPKLRILHLSDLHVDFKYKPGSNAECDEPLCCRGDHANSTSFEAGYWGDYRHCDTPTWTLEHLFEHLKSEKFDVIYWTGDLPGHDVWLQNQQEMKMLLKYLTDQLLKYFPHTPVYPTLGNHEGVPVNSFPPPFIHGNSSASWLYDELVETWSPWLPNSTFANISSGAYYTTVIRPGLRIISLNSNYCNNKNWWLLLNSTDPAHEIEWLARQLQASEDIGEKVHIIGHIPPGIPDCLKAWSWNYYNIINRYESTIAGQFFGHTHFDEMEIFYDVSSGLTRPVSVAYIGPSVTTFSDLNPGYRIYEVDGEYNGSTWHVLDHETYVMNLTEANLSSKKAPEWKLEYSAKSAYNMASLFPADWQDFYERASRNSTLLNMYYRHRFKMHPPTKSCDSGCRHYNLCSMKTGRSGDPSLCKDLNSSLSLQEIDASNRQWHKKYDYC